MTSNRNDPKKAQDPTEQHADPKADEKEEKEKNKKVAPEPEPKKKKPEEQKSDGPDIGGGLYQSLKRGVESTASNKPGLFRRLLNKLNPFRSTPEPPEKKVTEVLAQSAEKKSSAKAADEHLKSSDNNTPKSR